MFLRIGGDYSTTARFVNPYYPFRNLLIVCLNAMKRRTCRTVSGGIRVPALRARHCPSSIFALQCASQHLFAGLTHSESELFPNRYTGITATINRIVAQVFFRLSFVDLEEEVCAGQTRSGNQPECSKTRFSRLKNCAPFTPPLAPEP